MAIAFQGLPGPTRQRTFSKVLSWRFKRPLHFVVTSESVLGVPVHWDPKAGLHGRAFACAMGYCPRCKAGIPVRYRGYLSALVEPRWVHSLVELTDGAARQLAAIVGHDETEPAPILRGLCLQLWRRSESATAAMDLCRWENGKTVSSLPEPLDVRRLVGNLWSSDDGCRMEPSPFAAM